MILRINGDDENIVKCDNLLELINAKKLKIDRIVVEHNRKIVLKQDWSRVALNQNDSIEIVSFVGGG